MSLLDAIKSKRAAIAAKSNRERPVKLTSAKNQIRILPRWDGDFDGKFFQEFGQHFIKDKNGNVLAVYICTAQTFERECAVCSEIAKHSAALTDESLAGVLAGAKASSRYLVNAIYMNGTHANAKTEPVLLELSPSAFNGILAIAENYLEDHGINILDLKEGYDLVIAKSGSGLETKYSVTPSPKPRAIDPAVISKARNLEEYAKQEYDLGLQKALTSLGQAMGGNAALPGPAANRPALTQQNTAAQTLANTAPADLDVLEAEFEEVPPFETAAQAAAPAAAVPVASTDDLDDLDQALAELNAL